MYRGFPESILLKITGVAMRPVDNSPGDPGKTFVHMLALQLQTIAVNSRVAIVVGGGNFFRGSTDSVRYNIRIPVAHQIGMFATVMNALIVYDVLMQYDIPVALLASFDLPIGALATYESIEKAHAEKKIIIFAGGIGVPYVTTDTTAVLRALQVGATQVWKGTSVDGVFTTDPMVDHTARPYEYITYRYALQEQLKVMDATAYTLAQEYALLTRVFNIFNESSLLRVVRDTDYGTWIVPHTSMQKEYQEKGIQE